MQGGVARIGRWVRRIVVAVALLGAFGASALAGMVTAALPQLAAIEGSSAFQQREGYVYARDAKTVLRTLRAPTSRRYAHVGDVPEVVADAVIAAEDRRFREHHGIDPRGIARAAVTDLRQRSVAEGGSTITQQLVKNAYVGADRTVGRKSREALLAMALESRWSKDRILTAYLNTAYFGQGAYGIRDAARTYFGEKVQRLNLAQGALLAALLQSPGRDDPVLAPRRATARRNQVLAAMHELGMIGARDLRAATATRVPRSAHRPAVGGELAPHFVDSVVGDLARRFGVGRALGGGLRVTTTIDPRLQRAANDAAGRIDGTGLSTAIVSVRPRTGEVVALALGGPAADAAFDVALDGLRQPGSAFKPFALAAAFQAGLSPQAPLRSAPFTLPPREGDSGEVVRITNDSGRYAGATTLEQATWHSDNTAYARLADRLGIDAVIRAARAAGITSRIDPVLATVLGGLPEGVSPVELASAYGTFANHGVRATGDDNAPIRTLRVRGRGGAVLMRAAHASERRLPRGVADLVTQVLEGVITRGTGSAAAIGRPAAGKTGTTEHNADAWFVGYTPTLVTAVWVGHPEGAVPMQTQYHGGPVFGGTYPAEVWAAFVRAAGAAVGPTREFDLRLPRYVTVLVDPASGLLADAWCVGAVKQRFIDGQQPRNTSTSCPSRTRPVPNVTGLPVEQALAQLEADDFRTTRINVLGDAAEVGMVINQLPSAGTEVERTDAVRVTVVTRARLSTQASPSMNTQPPLPGEGL